MTTIEKRLSALERKVKTLNSLIRAGVVEKEDVWLKLSQASHVLGISPDTLRKKVRESQSDPVGSPYKQGVHWSGEKTYKINVSKWHTAI